jgi:hypothetical protein
MDFKVEDKAFSASSTDFVELNSPMLFRRSSPVLGLSYTIVISKTEPVNQVLPCQIMLL